MAFDPQLPGRNKLWTVGFVAGDTTLAKILVDVTAAQVIAALVGETAIPGESAVRQQILRGGSRVIGGSIASTDGTARSVLLYKGTQATLFANMGAPTITGTNVINRTTGSFITDGWRPGDYVFPFGMTTAGNNGVLGVVTTVTALALTVNGTPLSNETMPAGSRLIRAALLTRRGVPINSGNTDTTPPVVLIGSTQDPSAAPTPDAGWSLGPDDALLAAMVATISALPAAVTINAETVLY